MDQVGSAVSWSLRNTHPPNFIIYFLIAFLVTRAVEIGYHPLSGVEKNQFQVAKKSGMTVIVLCAFPGKIPLCDRWPEDTGTFGLQLFQ